MKAQISSTEWNKLQAEGYLRVPGAFGGGVLAGIDAAVQSLLTLYPHGFLSPPLYSGLKPWPRPVAPKPTDRAPTVIIPNVGFLSPELLKPLSNPYLHELLERIVGMDFYLSNTWFQMVPPGVGRLTYHKDPRGSITFNILLDDIGPKMGSTCLVPRSHLNTPPPAYCMNDVRRDDPREVDMVGNAGDLVLFTAEAWHGRSENLSSNWTRRLFYNFYSRSSRSTTAWADVVSDDQIAAARAVIPPDFHHMFRIDPEQTRRLATVNCTGLRRWGLQDSTAEGVFHGLVYSWSVHGRSTENVANPGFLLPHTTRLAEAGPFSARKYVMSLKPLPTIKNTVKAVQKRVLGRPRIVPHPMPVAE